jgi:hypothetical protein
MVVIIGAVVLWLLLSAFFEDIGNVVISIYSEFRNKLISNDDGEDNEDE